MIYRELIHQFIDLFRDMPHRASGTYTEQKSAQIIEHMGKSLFSENRVISSLPFAADISGGAWSVALHSFFYLFAVLLSMAVALVACLTSTELGVTARLGFIGDIPNLLLIFSFICCLLILISRYVSIGLGWSIFSFFIPNIDSANIVFFDRALRPEDSSSTSQSRRGRKLVLFMAHYDTARCLPKNLMPNRPGKYKLTSKIRRFTYKNLLVALVKNGLSIIPMIASWIILATLLYHILFSSLLNKPPLVWTIISTILICLLILSCIIILIEALIAKASSNLPFNPGFNDNLSGVSVLWGLLGLYFLKKDPESDRFPHVAKAIKEAMKPARQKGVRSLPPPPHTDLFFLFTGTEENGLRGAKVFRKHNLKNLIKEYGIDNTFVINLDSVSGANIDLFTREIDFVGLSRGGRQGFAAQCHSYLKASRYTWGDLIKYFNKDEIPLFFDNNGKNRFSPKVNLAGSALQSCTDMSGFCVTKAYNKRLNIFSIVSPESRSADTIPTPRDYHSLTDTYAALIDEQSPQNMGSIFFLVFILSKLIEGIDKNAIISG